MVPGDDEPSSPPASDAAALLERLMKCFPDPGSLDEIAAHDWARPGTLTGRANQLVVVRENILRQLASAAGTSFEKLQKATESIKVDELAKALSGATQPRTPIAFALPDELGASNGSPPRPGAANTPMADTSIQANLGALLKSVQSCGISDLLNEFAKIAEDAAQRQAWPDTVPAGIDVTRIADALDSLIGVVDSGWAATTFAGSVVDTTAAANAMRGLAAQLRAEAPPRP